jgi:hypothetical protein
MNISNEEYLKIKNCIDNLINNSSNKVLSEKEYYLIMSFIRGSHKVSEESRQFIETSGHIYYNDDMRYNLKTKYKPFNKKLETTLLKEECLTMNKTANEYIIYSLSYRNLLLYITSGKCFLSCGECTKEDMNKYIKENKEDKYTTKILNDVNSNPNKNFSTRGDVDYNNWIKDILERDNYICQCCESKLNPEVHHILNYAKYKELRTDINNGITLCECCHSPMIKDAFHNTYGTRNNTKKQLQAYINNKRKELGLDPKLI